MQEKNLFNLRCTGFLKDFLFRKLKSLKTFFSSLYMDKKTMNALFDMAFPKEVIEIKECDPHDWIEDEVYFCKKCGWKFKSRLFGKSVFKIDF